MLQVYTIRVPRSQQCIAVSSDPPSFFIYLSIIILQSTLLPPIVNLVSPIPLNLFVRGCTLRVLSRRRILAVLLFSFLSPLVRTLRNVSSLLSNQRAHFGHPSTGIDLQ
jgi:hypothetical protein